MKKIIERIDIYYTDGQHLEIWHSDLKRIKELGEAITWVQRAKEVYENLVPLFAKG